MNLVNGKIIGAGECDAVLERIEEMIMETLQKPPPDVNLVIDACDGIVRGIDGFGLDIKLRELGISPALIEIYMAQIKNMFNAEAIRERLNIELGAGYNRPRTLTYAHSGATAVQTLAPLGVLFHITAGNVDGLPFISLLDGLLTGNINIVKLPKEEGGVTVSLLMELFKAEPSLCEYVYVFDYSSKDLRAMKKLADASDAIVVWGGDEAVSAVRTMASPNTKIIEWGHKISFAYATIEGLSIESMEKLARHICLTNQLFCSSCQGVFIDTREMNDVYGFCEKFLPVLEKTCLDHPFTFDAAARLFIEAEITLKNYHMQIEGGDPARRVFTGQNSGVTAMGDGRLETSAMFRNIWAKPLTRNEIIKLRPYKGYLQTTALLCADNERAELSGKLLQAGVVKVSDGFEMSNYAFGEAHDGEFTLRRYTKLVSVQ